MRRELRRFTKFLGIFLLWALGVNALILETMGRVILKIPEPWDPGIFFFYSLFSLVGAILLFFSDCNAKKMGILSLVVGLLLEFTFMKPEWVQKFYALEINGEAIAPLIASSILAWFPIWFFPSYLVHKYVNKKKEKYSDKFAKRFLIIMIAICFCKIDFAFGNSLKCAGRDLNPGHRLGKPRS